MLVIGERDCMEMEKEGSERQNETRGGFGRWFQKKQIFSNEGSDEQWDICNSPKKVIEEES